MLELVSSATSLAVAVAIPFLGSLAKQHLIRAEELQFLWSASTEATNKGKTWKAHKQLRSAWPVVYALLGVASWLVWRQGGFAAQKGALGRYACLLLANVLCWPPIFFGGHSRRFAFLDCGVLLLAVLLTIPKFYEVDPLAGMLLLPYLGWTCFASTLINCSLLSGNTQVVERVEKLTAVGPQPQPTHEVRPRHSGKQHNEQPPQQPSAAANRTILHVDVPPIVTDAATSPFQDAAAIKSPLAQAKDLLGKLSETLAVEGNSTVEPASTEYLRAGILRVNSLLSKVSYSLQGAGSALAESRGPSGALARMGSLLSRVSLSLQRGGSQDDESLKWPTSDSIPRSYFSFPGPAGYKVRGANYLSDKQKFVPEKCQGKLVSLNLVSVKEPTFHIARFLPSIRDSKAPFIFVWQVMVPGRTHISLTVAWALDGEAAKFLREASIPEGDEDEPDVIPAAAATAVAAADSPEGRRSSQGNQSELQVQASSKSTSSLAVPQAVGRGHRRTATTLPSGVSAVAERLSVCSESGDAAPRLPVPEGAPPFSVALARFLDESGSEKETTARRHAMFKIIPRIEKGGWVVKQAVGQNTPVLLGRKLTTKYFRGPRYMEADVDVGSSRSAASVVGLVQGALKTLVIDIAVLLEGKTPEELPENLIGTIRLEHLDLSKAATLDTETGHITRKD